MRHYTDTDLVLLLRGRCDASTQKQAAAELGFPPSFVNDVLMGRRAMTANLADALGFTKLPDAYIRKSK